MIFVTVGAQLPFDRLVQAVDKWSELNGRDDVFAQIGATDWRPAHLRWTQFLTPAEFHAYVGKARVVVAHAGMGSIITALEFGRPILVMPRRGALMETRNDHQVATAKRFLELGQVAVALDEEELATKLDGLDDLLPQQCIRTQASAQLLETIRDFVSLSTCETRLRDFRGKLDT